MLSILVWWKTEIHNFDLLHSFILTLQSIKLAQNFKNAMISTWGIVKNHLMHVDKWLRFNQHIEYLVKILNKFCGPIYRHMFPRNCLLMLFTLLRKISEYGIIAYGATAKTNLSRIEMAQRRIMRAIFFKKKIDSKTDVLREKGI